MREISRKSHEKCIQSTSLHPFPFERRVAVEGPKRGDERQLGRKRDDLIGPKTVVVVVVVAAVQRNLFQVEECNPMGSRAPGDKWSLESRDQVGTVKPLVGRD